MTITFLRTLIVYAVIIAAMRLMGKRQLGELELSEFAVTILISQLVANPLQDLEIPLISGLIPAITLLCCELLLSYLILKSMRFRAFLCGKPSMLIANGMLDQREMKKNRFTLDELTEELRNQSITDLSKIQYAILETDGTLNTILYPAEQPVTPAQLQIEVENTGYPTILINDGKVVGNNLRRMGRDMCWLENELRKHGAASPAQVYLLTLNDAGQIYYVGKESKNG